MDDKFELYDLKVEVVKGDKPFVCSHHVGDYFLVKGENLEFPGNNFFLFTPWRHYFRFYQPSREYFRKMTG